MAAILECPSGNTYAVPCEKASMEVHKADEHIWNFVFLKEKQKYQSYLFFHILFHFKLYNDISYYSCKKSPTVSNKRVQKSREFLET